MIDISKFTCEHVRAEEEFTTYLVNVCHINLNEKLEILDSKVCFQEDFDNLSDFLSEVINKMNFSTKNIKAVNPKLNASYCLPRKGVNETSYILEHTAFDVSIEESDESVSLSDAPHGFFLEIFRTQQGKVLYRNHQENRIKKINSLSEDFKQAVMEEFKVAEPLFAFLTQNMNINPTSPATLKAIIHRLTQYREVSPINALAGK